MRKNVLLIAFALVASFTFAQGTLGEGNLQANAGLGFSGWGVPLFAGLDYGITDEITVGGEVSYRSNSVASVKWTAIGIFANANYHFNKILKIPSEFDVYAGASLGYYNWSSNIKIPNTSKASYNSGIGFTGQLGARYFFNDQFGLNLEFGAGNVAGGKLGITYKL